MVKHIIPILPVLLFLTGCDTVNMGRDFNECVMNNMDRAHTELTAQLLASACIDRHEED